MYRTDHPYRLALRQHEQTKCFAVGAGFSPKIPPWTTLRESCLSIGKWSIGITARLFADFHGYVPMPRSDAAYAAWENNTLFPRRIGVYVAGTRNAQKQGLE
jgi:hypothetical protein